MLQTRERTLRMQKHAHTLEEISARGEGVSDLPSMRFTLRVAVSVGLLIAYSIQDLAAAIREGQ